MGFFFEKTLGYQEGHLIGSFFSFPLSHLGWDTNLSEKKKRNETNLQTHLTVVWVPDLLAGWPASIGLSILTQYLCQVLNMVSGYLEVSSSQRFLEKTNFPLSLPIIFSFCGKAKELIPWWETCLASLSQTPPDRPGPSANSIAAALVYAQGQPATLTGLRCTKLPENNVSLHSTTNRRKIHTEGESHWVRSQE